MLTLRRGRITAVLEELDGLTRLEVDGTPCIAFPRLTGPVAEDDDVIVNVQARELGLGSGGFDVLYANLTRGLSLPPESGAHPETIAGMPVVCCTVHSQVAPVCAGIGAGARVAYVQLAGGALPVSLSDTVRALRERG